MNVGYFPVHYNGRIGHARAGTQESSDLDELICGGLHALPIHTDARNDPNWKGQIQEARRWAGQFNKQMVMQQLPSRPRTRPFAEALGLLSSCTEGV